MMEHRCIKAHKDSPRKSPNKFSYSRSGLLKCTCPECKLSLSIRKNKKFVPRCRISKRITSFDEKYLSHCLELIQISASKESSFNSSVAWSHSNTNCSTESNFPSPGNVSSFSSKSESMILQSPLFKHVKTGNDSDSEVINFPSATGLLDSYCDTSPRGFSFCSSPMLEMESVTLKDESDDIFSKGRSQCTSSVVSTFSYQFTDTWPAVSHGILQCSQRNGIPHFVFSMDNKQEIYTTKLSKSVSSDESSQDWTYFIYSSYSNWREHNRQKIESSLLVGRINVSTSYKISGEGSKIMETEFILYGDNECEQEELDKSCLSYNMKKHRRLPGKVLKFLKPLHLPTLRFDSTSLELSSMTREHNEGCGSDEISHPNLLESNVPSNFELAAIIVKEQVEVMQQETELGGWGLSFLKRATEKLATDSKSTVVRDMNVIIPAGVHGGSKTGNDGPSSLTERWRNGGQCDCGGWDTGCPLMVLKTRPDGESVCKSLDLFLKEDTGCPPSMKMVNIHNGLYSIYYQPILSPLQCFSIAVAVIHSRSSTLRLNTQTC